MNELPTTLLTGTFGELLVQLRLFMHSVQAAPPIKDSGNDLIAIRRHAMKAVQVKTTCANFPIEFDVKDLPDLYHVLAIVKLPQKIHYDDLIDFEFSLDEVRVFLLEKHQVTKGYWTEEELVKFELSEERIDAIFPDKEHVIIVSPSGEMKVKSPIIVE